jgi:predicted permease
MFITVLIQVTILFILIAIGFVLAKTQVLNDKGAKCITDLVLYSVTPCVIVKSFVREFSTDLLKSLLVSISAIVCIHIVFILVTSLILRSKNISRQKVLQFGVVFSNCGYMSIPLLQAVLGDIGVFYAATYIAVFQLFIWSYGVALMGGKEFITAKKLIINPGIIGFIVALLVFILQIPIPNVIYEPMSHMANLNTPLPMIIIGYHLAHSDLVKGLKDIKVLYSCILRLFVLPLIVLFGFYLCGFKGTLPLALTICASAPSAATGTMFAAKFGQDTALSVRFVSISTILSIISMPLIATLAQHLLK